MLGTSMCRAAGRRSFGLSACFVSQDISLTPLPIPTPPSSYSSRPFHTSIHAEKHQQSSGGGVVKKYKKKQPGMLRADRILSNRGLGTRSQTSKLLRQKRVGYLDKTTGQIVGIKGPSEKVHPEATLYLDGNELPGPPPPILIYHKPKYVLSAMDDKERSHLGEKLEECELQTSNALHPVGRLDYETTGLILFSSSGELTQRLLHPRRGVEKEYVARVEGVVDEAELRNKLSSGVETAEGVHQADLLEVIPVPASEDKDDNETMEQTDVRVVVTEGKHRMVRRMLANCGHPVSELKRERHGEVRLGDLPVGKFRQPTDEEISWTESLLQ
mmetsp:Transcript_12625/g.21024  ORF Transcript_12625/g.21024 Transcript_12625/m.21024 type:complete len:329 (-) Transcript_12625:30-1016(-)